MAGVSLAPDYGSLESSANWGPVPTSTAGPSGASSGVVDHAGTTSQPYFTEPSCVRGYVPKPWKSRSEEDFDEGQLLLFIRTTPAVKQHKEVGALNLGQTNIKLYDLGRKAKELFRTRKELLPSNMNPTHLLKLLTLPQCFWGFQSNIDTLVEPVSAQPGGHAVRFLSIDTIRLMFNIGGVIQNLMGGTNDPTTLERKDKRRLDINVVNVVVKDIAEINNYWGLGVKIGSRLWLILKRVQDPVTKTWGQYAFVPHHTYQRDEPSLHARCFRDHTGTRQYGVCFYIGQVLDNEWPQQTPQGIAVKAAGLIGTADEQQNSEALTKPLRINYAPLPGRERRYLL